MGARVRAGDQRPGRGPSQHGDSRAHRVAGARAGHSGGLSRVRAAPDGDRDEGGAEMKLSKRAGSYLTVRELVDEVGRDAVRYFFLMRRGDSHLVFDV